jgi:hypothetical protein
VEQLVAERGDERLSLLLWAVWNPIGPVPLDEYASYTGQVASVLRRGHEAEETAGLDEELVTLLARLRSEHMGMPPNPDADRRAGRTLGEWYMWEMEELGSRASLKSSC